MKRMKMVKATSKINNFREKWLIAKCGCFGNCSCNPNCHLQLNAHIFMCIAYEQKKVGEFVVSRRLTIGVSNGKTGTNSISISGVYVFLSFLILFFCAARFFCVCRELNDFAVTSTHATPLAIQPFIRTTMWFFLLIFRFLVVYFIFQSIVSR